MEKKTAIYPGTFDPITNGHIALIERATGLFDNIIVAVAENAGKSPFFSHQDRFDLVRASLKDIPQIKIIKFTGLLADLAKDRNACAIVRGLRAVSDFEYEFQMALMNRKLARNLETVFLMSSLRWVYLSSTIVKDVAWNNGEIEELVPPEVAVAVRKKIKTARG